MGGLLGKYADIMDGLDDFLTQCENNGNVQATFLLCRKSSFFFLLLFLIKCCHAEGFLAGVTNKSKLYDYLFLFSFDRSSLSS